MNLVDEDAFFYGRITVHDQIYCIDICIKDSDTRYVTSVGDRADNREQSLGTKREIPSPVLPDDLFHSGLVAIRPGLLNHDAVIPGAGDHLLHEIVGNFFHVKGHLKRDSF